MDFHALEAASIVPPLISLPLAWSGTAGELLEALGKSAGENVIRREEWPANPQALSGALRRLAPDLRSIGIEVTFVKRGDRRRPISIHRSELEGTQRSEGKLVCRCAVAAVGRQERPHWPTEGRLGCGHPHREVGHARHLA
jgi:hypothetical protein